MNLIKNSEQYQIVDANHNLSGEVPKFMTNGSWNVYIYSSNGEFYSDYNSTDPITSLNLNSSNRISGEIFQNILNLVDYTKTYLNLE